jgi:peptidoglycan/xylan/chitin deacetylase (PgdA/CDA1 family)
LNYLFAKKLLYRFQRRSLVLMYHNIAEPGIDPWELAVSPYNFRQHLEVLQKYRVISIAEMSESLTKGSLVSGSVAITFDDGYEDNFLNAKPLLEEYRHPATFFIATGYLGGERMFWWDELDQLFLTRPVLPEKLSLKIGSEAFRYSLEDDALLTPEKAASQASWYWHQPSPTRRGILYFEVWKRLRPLPDEEIYSAINELKQWAGMQTMDAAKHAMTRDQLFTLKAHPLIQTGIHTVSHPALASHGIAQQMQEIDTCRKELLDMGMMASHLAYPYGNFNQDTVKVCHDLKLSSAFTTSERMITAKTKQYQIGRFQVRNVDGNAFEKQLQKWMTEFPS